MAERKNERKDEYNDEIYRGNGYFANMPPDVKMNLYPKQSYALRDGMLDDTIKGIDETDHFNDRRVEDHFSDSMY